jgi:hypothetical protein
VSILVPPRSAGALPQARALSHRGLRLRLTASPRAVGLVPGRDDVRAGGRRREQEQGVSLTARRRSPRASGANRRLGAAPSIGSAGVIEEWGGLRGSNP